MGVGRGLDDGDRSLGSFGSVVMMVTPESAYIDLDGWLNSLGLDVSSIRYTWVLDLPGYKKQRSA